jgi:hypothetical protein
MKARTLLVAVAITITLALVTGCATQGVKPLSPAQVAQVACPQVKLVNAQLTSLNTALLASPATASFAAKANATIATLQPTVDAVCAAGATVTAPNLQALAQQALPALATIVSTLPIPPAQEAQIQAGLIAAQIAFSAAGIVVQQVKAAQAPAPASSAAPKP